MKAHKKGLLIGYFITWQEDRPLFVLFGASDPKLLLKAAMFAQEHCDYVDINLGCRAVSPKSCDFMTGGVVDSLECRRVMQAGEKARAL